MSKPGPVGGTATLSSYRVQKAFSINFRENKRLLAEIKLIENEHIRNIRYVKQEIKETRIWLENIRESTGESHHGLRPDSEPSLKKNKKRRKAPPRSKTVEPQVIVPSYPAPSVSQLSGDEYDDMTTKYSEQEPVQKVRFENKESSKEAAPVVNTLTIPAARPWTESATAKSKPTQQQQRDNLKSEPTGQTTRQRSEPQKEEPTEDDTDETKNRVNSANSVRSSLASLTAYQRRHKLQSMMVKKQNPLEYKRQINARDCYRVNNKVNTYLESLSDSLKITMPDLTQWGVNPKHHDTPFAQDVSLT